MKTLRGIVKGQTIELTEPPGVAEGEHVVVQLSIVNSERPVSDPSDEGPMSAYWTEEDDSIFAQIERERKTADTRPPPE